jgi:maltose alpha-D-glucosyltransferase/alpha-amylase
MALVTLHNFADRAVTARFDVGTPDGAVVCDLFDEDHSRAGASGRHEINLGPYMHKWYRVGGPDTALKRAHF